MNALTPTITDDVIEHLDDPESFNDAELLGIELPGFKALLDRPATFLLGQLWGLRDHRNTQDGDWKPVTQTWAQWITGAPKQPRASAWGFSRHPVSSHKEGACVVLGSSVGGARKAKAMDTMFAMGLDIDAGASLDDVLDTLEKLGKACLVYTTHSHGRRGLQVKRDEVMRKLNIKTDPTLDQVKDYLNHHGKKGYELSSEEW